ncbi:hypothetical protein [Ktedonosporobacter rubrisoli]|uniref:hypothetical protein n=1 Tax=Ktedonosporobacter rubrisoli TaxID=2509675 RepID=UPI0013EE5036|nr:hypothetical protein [Ktedonosporobacter rubrisoli]
MADQQPTQQPNQPAHLNEVDEELELIYTIVTDPETPIRLPITEEQQAVKKSNQQK